MNHPTAVPYYLQTMPGVEEIAWLEVRRRLPGAKFGEYLFAKDQNGLLLFETSDEPQELLNLRTAEDVFFLAVNEPRMTRGRQDLQTITTLVHKGEDFGRAANHFLRYLKLSGPPTFRVISRKYGQHQYRRIDMETAVLQGIQQRYPRWTPVADGGQIEVWANMLGSQLVIGLRLSDRSMRHRYQKRVELPASLRPSVAAAMVLLTDPEADDIFLDPMCGSGTILLERINAGPYQQVLGGDSDNTRVNAARQNLPQQRKGRKADKIVVRQWDARRLPLDDGSVDKVATNLPFGKQVSAGQNLEALYQETVAELARVVRPEGKLVLLSSEYDLLKECIRREPALNILTGYSVAILGHWGRIYIIERLS
jgi:23S rRNA G2445 N2-methylase RlmL